ncbi:aldo/keto reductase [Undibacterium baiyunense]|uniref:Aldo/keto reductase n=1 Tax=Undibacterium baiyunense TaxID=2828731 RepID=A0A941DEB3_9BURK|nr:aldo/keto reductase [Undibacterium baiyunense]MBR7747164.1 aldo/keto reductase [Undibacterium baiyunense]
MPSLTSRLQIAPQGPEFSRIVLGLWRLSAWQMTPVERVAFLHAALDLGITTIDQADIYGDYTSELLLGEAFALEPQLRQQFQIVTKCGIQFPSPQRPHQRAHIYNTTAAHIIASAENSLRSMRLEKIDLLLIHRPDPLMDADEIADAFSQLKQAGKVSHFGVSNFSPAQFELLASRFPLVTNQVECSLLHHAPIYDGTFDQCQRLRMSPMIWSALAGGRLFSEQSEQTQKLQAQLDRIASELGVTAACVAIAWILQLPSRPMVLTGSSRVKVLAEAVQALNCSLSREQWFDLWRAATGTELP